jgi:hypothetical protein
VVHTSRPTLRSQHSENEKRCNSEASHTAASFEAKVQICSLKAYLLLISSCTGSRSHAQSSPAIKSLYGENYRFPRLNSVFPLLGDNIDTIKNNTETDASKEVGL